MNTLGPSLYPHNASLSLGCSGSLMMTPHPCCPQCLQGLAELCSPLQEGRGAGLASLCQPLGALNPGLEKYTLQSSLEANGREWKKRASGSPCIPRGETAQP